MMIYWASNHLTILRMQVDEFVAEGPIRNALYIGFPVDSRAG